MPPPQASCAASSPRHRHTPDALCPAHSFAASAAAHAELGRHSSAPNSHTLCPRFSSPAQQQRQQQQQQQQQHMPFGARVATADFGTALGSGVMGMGAGAAGTLVGRGRGASGGGSPMAFYGAGGAGVSRESLSDFAIFE